MPETHAEPPKSDLPTSSIDARRIAQLGARIGALKLDARSEQRAFAVALRALWDAAVLDRTLALCRSLLGGVPAAIPVLQGTLLLAARSASAWARTPSAARVGEGPPCKPTHLISPIELPTLFMAAERVAALQGASHKDLLVGALELWSRAAPAEQLVHAADEPAGKALGSLLSGAVAKLPWGEGGRFFPGAGDATWPWPEEVGNPPRPRGGAVGGLPWPEVDGPPWPSPNGLPRPKWPASPRDELFPLDHCEASRRVCEMDVIGVLRGFQPLPSSAWKGKITGLTPTAACPGHTLVLHGVSFGATQPPHIAVLIGEVEAPVVTWSDTRITIIVPSFAHAGTVGFRDRTAESERARAFENNQRALDDLGNGLSCLGQARRFPASVYQPAPVVENQAARFGGTTPEIDFFRANGSAGGVVVRPGEAVTLTWGVRNATDVRVRPLSTVGPQAATQNPTLPQLALGPFSGRAAAVASYRLEATNGCGTVTRDLDVRLDVAPTLRIVGVEVTQSIQRFSLTATYPRNTERLAAGKATQVRVYVASGIDDGFDRGAGPGVVANVTGSLLLTQVDGSTVRMVLPVGPDLAAPSAAGLDRERWTSSFNLVLPASLATGTQDIEARVWVRDDATVAPAVASTRVRFHDMPNLPIVMVRVADPGRNLAAPSISTYTYTLANALGRLPFGEESAHILLAPGYEVWSISHDLGTEEGWHDLLDDLDDIASDFGDMGEVWAAMTPDHPDYDLNGVGSDGVIDYWFDGARRFAARSGLPATFAHELCHTFGVGHAPCGDVVQLDPRLPAATEDVGLDVRWSRVVPAGTSELMSYCTPNSGDFQDRWPSIALWDLLARR